MYTCVRIRTRDTPTKSPRRRASEQEREGGRERGREREEGGVRTEEAGRDRESARAGARVTSAPTQAQVRDVII